jgi:hypothetical protein
LIACAACSGGLAPAASGSRDAATLDDAKEGAQKRKVFERGHAENE